MKSYQAQTNIGVPPQAVFDYVSDFTKHGEWAGHGLAITKDSDGPVAIGSTYSTTAKQFGTQKEHSTVSEFDPPKVFGWDSTGALGTVHHRFTVSSSEGMTGVTKSADLTEPSFLAKLTGWKLAKDIPAGLRSDVENIKKHLEKASS